MEFIHNATKYKVKWVHFHPKRRHRIMYNDGTRCNIEVNYGVDSEFNNENYMGKSHLSQQDNFCRKTGRKISMARAIKGFSKELRTVFWSNYFQHCK